MFLGHLHEMQKCMLHAILENQPLLYNGYLIIKSKFGCDFFILLDQKRKVFIKFGDGLGHDVTTGKIFPLCWPFCGDVNSSLPEQKGRHFADDSFKCNSMNEIFCISIQIWLMFVSSGPFDNNPALI